MIGPALIGSLSAQTSGVTPPDNPPVTDGLVLWLDASQLSYADGAIVTSWPDLSPAATPVSMVGANPVMRTTGINGHRGVDTSAQNPTATISFGGATEGTLITVQKSSAVAETTNHGFNPGSGLDSWIPYVDGNIYDQNMASSRANVALPGGLTQSTPYSYIARAASGSRQVWYKGSILINDTASYSQPGSPQRIGRSNLGQTESRLVTGELLYYTRALTDDEIASMLAYLSDKWGVA